MRPCSASSTTTNSPSLQFISSEIARVPHLDVASTTPDGFQIWKQRWSSAVTITGFTALSQETQLALFTNVLSDDTVKKMNLLALPDVNAIIEAFQTQVCGSTSVFVHEYEFHNRIQGSNESFQEFYTDLQSLFSKCQYEDCCKTATKMSCKERVLLARLVAGIRSTDLRKSLLCIQDLTLEKAVQHVQIDEVTSILATQFSPQVNNAGASTYKQGKGTTTSYKQSPPHREIRDETPRRCKFCMKFDTFRKELCPAKDSICKVCHNRGHWANSLMCPSTTKPSAGRSSEESKPDSRPVQAKSSSNPSLKLMSALGESQISATVSVKSINVSPIPSVGSHCHVDFLIGNNNWIQSCTIAWC